MTHGQLTTDLAEVFDVLKARLASVTNVPADHIVLTAEASEDVSERPYSDIYIAVRIGGFQPHAGVIQGAGNNLVHFRGTIVVDVFSRLYSDMDTRSYNLITDASQGLMALWLKTLAALHQYEAPRPETPTKSLLTEPITSGGFEIPRRRIPRGWGMLTSSWQIGFLHRLS